MPSRWWASSFAGFFSSTTPSGMPLMNSTTSGRRVLWFSVTRELVDCEASRYCPGCRSR